MNDNGLTDKEEHYCQLRADGKTRTDAARIAYETKNPRQMGSATEKREDVLARIQELKEERAEAYGLDAGEQIRRYNQLYQMALDKGQIGVAAKMLERLDILGGFEAPTKSVNFKGSIGEALKDPNGNLRGDLEKFAGMLNRHTEKVKEGEIVAAEPIEGDTKEEPKGVIH